MIRYSNRGGNSGVAAYEIGDRFIRVKFNGNATIYQYSYDGRAGQTRVEKMKSLALSGSGLNAYINNHAKFLYD